MSTRAPPARRILGFEGGHDWLDRAGWTWTSRCRRSTPTGIRRFHGYHYFSDHPEVAVSWFDAHVD